MGISEETKQSRHKSSESVKQSSPGSTTTSTPQATYAEPHDKVDQMREILFGAQRDEYDRRFTRMEELLVKSVSSINNDMTEKLSALRAEYDKRLARLEELLAKSIAEVSNDTTKKVNALQDASDKKFAHVEESLNALKSDIQNRCDKKVDKAAISKLLQQIIKLSNDLDIARTDNPRHE